MQRVNTYRPAMHAGVPRAIHGRSPARGWPVGFSTAPVVSLPVKSGHGRRIAGRWASPSRTKQKCRFAWKAQCSGWLRCLSLAQRLVVHEPHFASESLARVRSVALKLAQDRLDDLRRLVLAHLPLGDDPRRDEAEPDRAATVAARVRGHLGRASSGRGSATCCSKCSTKRVRTSKFSSGPRTSGTPERCATMKFHVGTSM